MTLNRFLAFVGILAACYAIIYFSVSIAAD